MGGDGGTISNRRDCIVTTKRQVVVEDPQAQALAKFMNCTLTALPLVAPVVTDKLGRLYNKEALLKEHFLAHPSLRQPKNSHIESMADLIQLKMTPDDDPKDRCFFKCPVTGLKATGAHRFVVIRKCGCVLSEKAVKEIESPVCLACGVELGPEKGLDLFVIISPTDAEEAQLRERMNVEKAVLKAKAAEAKRRKKEEKEQKEKEGKQPLGEKKEDTEAEETKKRKKNLVADASLARSKATRSITVVDAAAASAATNADAAIRAKAASDKLYSSLFYSEKQLQEDRKKAPAWIISTKRAGFAE